MTDEPDKAELENRIEKLEATIEKMMPSRRDALKMGGAALAGGSLMAGTASAGTNQVGTIGSASQPVDVESEDITNADTMTTRSLEVTDGLVAGELLGTDSGGSQVQVTGINFDSFKQLILFGIFKGNAATDVELTIDGVSSGGEYNFFDHDGTINNGEDTLRLLDASDDIEIVGTVVMTQQELGGRQLLECNLAPAFKLSRTNKLALKGGSNVQTGQGSVEISCEAATANNLEVYGIR